MRLRKQVRRGRTFWSRGPSEFCVNKAPQAGNLQQALSDCENALDSSIETHDVNGESLMRTDLAAIYYQQGDLKEAEKICSAGTCRISPGRKPLGSCYGFE